MGKWHVVSVPHGEVYDAAVKRFGAPPILLKPHMVNQILFELLPPNRDRIKWSFQEPYSSKRHFVFKFKSETDAIAFKLGWHNGTA